MSRTTVMAVNADVSALEELVGYTIGEVLTETDASGDGWSMRADKTIENVTISRELSYNGEEDTYYISNEYILEIAPRVVEI